MPRVLGLDVLRPFPLFDFTDKTGVVIGSERSPRRQDCVSQEAHYSKNREHYGQALYVFSPSPSVTVIIVNHFNNSANNPEYRNRTAYRTAKWQYQRRHATIRSEEHTSEL